MGRHHFLQPLSRPGQPRPVFHSWHHDVDEGLTGHGYSAWRRRSPAMASQQPRLMRVRPAPPRPGFHHQRYRQHGCPFHHATCQFRQRGGFRLGHFKQ